MTEEDGLTLSDEDDFLEESLYQGLPEMHGTLSKWTNYIHGWQDRFVILKQGTLSYYKSEDDVEFGCRGAVSLSKAVITAHELDELRFDVNVNDSSWYLRTETARERNRWMDAIDFYKTGSGSGDSGFSGSENSLLLRRQPSCLSIASHTSLLSTTQSASSLKRGGFHCLREKVAEMETFRDIMCQQIDGLQAHFDACARLQPIASLVWPKGGEPQPPTHPQDQDGCLPSTPVADGGSCSTGPPLDFKGQAFSFKATAGGLMNTLAHCIDLLTLREEHWRRKLEKEVEKRKKFEELYKAAQNCNLKNTLTFGGPDFEEGPHCAIKEEEFFDAVESTLDKFDKEEHELLQRQKLAARNVAYQTAISSLATPGNPKTHLLLLQHPHKLSAEIDRVFSEQLENAQIDVMGGRDWQLIAEEGDMKMYKKELEEEGLVCDPLKAIHTVNGVTAREVCHYFFDPKYRHDWETTLDTMKILEAPAQDTLIFHQVHKRVWPATQRDSCFWSHIRSVGPRTGPADRLWAVCNYSVDHGGAAVNNCIRVKLAVFLHCRTLVDDDFADTPLASVPRQNVRCQITYCSKINPGGWTPPTVLRAVYKREYPKFLKKFTGYVQNMTKDKEPLH